MPFQPLKDKVSIFNTENTESSVHSQACHDDRICVENTQIYSLLCKFWSFLSSDVMVIKIQIFEYNTVSIDINYFQTVLKFGSGT